jgi:oxalate decarboxylase/phosphoglucose isomerase-like protein (cupin superfamily)
MFFIAIEDFNLKTISNQIAGKNRCPYGAIPKGMAHYVQNLGDEPLRYLEMFRSPRFMDVSLNQWIGLTPPELVKAHLNLDQKTMAALRKDKPIIVPMRPQRSRT